MSFDVPIAADFGVYVFFFEVFFMHFGGFVSKYRKRVLLPSSSRLPAGRAGDFFPGALFNCLLDCTTSNFEGT